MGYKNFTVGIKRILKQVSPSVKISQISIDNLNTFANVFLIAIIHEIAKIMQNNMFSKKRMRRSRKSRKQRGSKNHDRKTIKDNDIITAVKIVLPGELSKHALYEGNKAVRKFQEYNKEREQKRRQLWQQGKRASFPRTSKFIKTELVLSVPRVESILRENLPKFVSQEASIYLAAVLEYLLAELLELSSSIATQFRRTIITPSDLSLSIGNDEELNNLMYRLKFRFIGHGFIDIPYMYINKINERKSRKRKSRKRKSRKRKSRSRSVSRSRTSGSSTRSGSIRNSSSSSSAGGHAREALGL